MKKKICKTCKLFVEGSECPLCKGNKFVTTFKGRIGVVDAGKSEIAKKIGIKSKGEYAIKI